MGKLKIAFIHFHLKTGGVTTVIRHQAQAVAQNRQGVILSGEAPAAPFPLETVYIPGLGYDSPNRPFVPPAETAQAIESAIYDRWPQGCDLIHVHNPGLAKNQTLLETLDILLRRGFRLFLQFHDFAEDGRPHIYFHQPYPADCHYGVLNSRDYRILRQAGLKSQGLHLLPNPVDAPPSCNERNGPENHILYPIRAIRRKNIGEALLLSLFFNDGQELAITQPPSSPADWRSYADWKAFARTHDLPVWFEAGQSKSFGALVNGAHSFVTTSITEGFGFSFLEPWLAGKFLWGRRLPEICGDFEQNNIDLSHLYGAIQVPLNWIDPERFYQRWADCMSQVLSQYHRPMDQNRLDRYYQAIIAGDQIDFGLLDEIGQRAVLSRMLSDRREKKRLQKMNPFLAGPDKRGEKSPVIRKNQAAISRHYRPAQYQTVLFSVYEKVISSPVRHRPDKARIWDAFFVPQNLSLLKWSAYVR